MTPSVAAILPSFQGALIDKLSNENVGSAGGGRSADAHRTQEPETMRGQQVAI
jgi:hypothetical protein